MALSKASARLVRQVGAERKVGKYIARARDGACFDGFKKLVHRHSLEALTNPTRLLTLPHLINSVATRIPRLTDASRVLIEGYLLDLIQQGDLARLTTLNKNFEPYQAIFASVSQELVANAVADLEATLSKKEALSLDDASQIIPSELSSRTQNIIILFGHLLYSGSATTDVAPGVGIDSIRLPHAAPRF